MQRLIKILLVIIVAVILLGAVAMQFTAVQDHLMARVIASRVNHVPTHLLDNTAMRALVCGSTSPLADKHRAKTCIAVFAGGKFYVVDTGNGSWNNLGLWRIPAKHIGGIFLTHFHSDHIAELGEFNMQTWAAGRPAPLAVHGPEGVKKVVDGFSLAYELSRSYRTAHHGAEYMDPEIGKMQAIEHPATEPTVIVEENGVTITMFPVEHAPIKPAVGYRFDYGGRSVVITGDTTKSDHVIAAARGADVLFHEAQANHMVAQIQQALLKAGDTQVSKLISDIPDYHTSPVQAAEVANSANAKLLVMYHLTPPPPNRIAEKIFMRGVSDIREQGTILSDDGFLVTLPKNSQAIITGHIEK